MAVTKEVYYLPIGFNINDLCDIYRDAFIDAGYMASWYHSFTEAGRQHRVMEITYDGAKTYGKTYYNFVFDALGGGSGIGVGIGTGFDTGTNLFTGTQFVDYHEQPSNLHQTSQIQGRTPISRSLTTISNAQEYFLYRYTSSTDPTQSWFMSRVNTTYSTPFSFLHPSTTIHPWLDMNKGPVSGLINLVPSIRGNGAVICFGIQENIRRCVGIGNSLIGSSIAYSGSTNNWYQQLSYHMAGIPTHAYVAPGLVSGTSVATTQLNLANGTVGNNWGGGGHIVLPVGRTDINDAYTTDFTPICTSVPFSYYTNKLLAADFGIYGHYADNIQQPLDKFITTPGVEEWEIISRANPDTITTKASISFLARVV